ncbi:MAG: hypothetical protein ICV54_00290 [Nostoc sp. C3-bin3]|nr:hypothetical protein [Nostoc sp. C3-bin3]
MVLAYLHSDGIIQASTADVVRFSFSPAYLATSSIWFVRVQRAEAADHLNIDNTTTSAATLERGVSRRVV